MSHEPVPTREECQAYARRWKELGSLLEQIRDHEIRQTDTVSAIQSFDQAVRIALRDLPPRPTSGLVAWQRWMAVWRQRGPHRRGLSATLVSRHAQLPFLRDRRPCGATTGRARLTRDIDISLLAGFGGEERYVDLRLESASTFLSPDSRTKKR